MSSVQIAKLKNNLSSYLRRVRQGKEVVIKDRETPFAKIIPFSANEPRLVIWPAKSSPKDLMKIIKKIPPTPTPLKFSSMKVLRENREDRYP